MNTKKDTLYYDGQCPLCAKEIRFLQKKQTGQLAFADIHQYSAADLPAERSDMLKRLHLQTADQQWQIGLDATVTAWAHTPYGWAFKPLRWPVVRNIADWFYRQWADRRYQKRYVCNPCSLDANE